MALSAWEGLLFMILNDTERLARVAAEDAADSRRERTQKLADIAEAAKSATLAADNGRDVTNRDEAGRWLPPHKLQRALCHLNPSLRFETAHSDPSKTGIYIHDGVSNLGTPYHGYRFICGMESGFSPEFSIRMEKNGAMSGEVRGWRTVLAMLIRQRLVSKYEAENLFRVNFGRESDNWQRLTT